MSHPSTADPSSTATTDRWLPHAPGFREHIASPLRQHAQDLEYFSDILGSWQSPSGTAPTALILGVTPELYHLPWPDASRVSALDQAAAMIRDVWPGPPQAATHGNWLDMPFATGSMDIVLCDGGLHLLDYPAQQFALAANINRVLAPQGLCSFRLFVPPETAQSPEAVLSELDAGQIENMNCLKLKLGMALQQQASAGVRLGDIWQRLQTHVPDPATIVRQPGWTLANYQTIAAYQNSDTRYHFSDLRQVIALFQEASEGRLQPVRVCTPSYTMGDQCPIVTFRAS